MSKRIIALVSVMTIVLLCSFPAFAAAGGPQYRASLPFDLYTDSYGTIKGHMNLTSFYYTTDTYQLTSSVTQSDDTFKVLGQFIVYNTTDQDFMFTGSKYQLFRFYIKTANNYPSNIFVRLTDCKYLGGQMIISSITNDNIFDFENVSLDNEGVPRNIIVPAHNSVNCYFELTYTITYTNPTTSSHNNAPQFNASTVTLVPNQNIDGSFGSYHESYSSYLPDIYDQLVDIYNNNQLQLQVLQQILASYNANVPISQDATLDSQDSQTTSQQQHQVELSQFNNTNTALSNSGISNYSFNQEQVGGIGGVSNDFTYVFNALGSWNQVYIFALTLTLALAIIRHVRPKRSSDD